MLKKHWYSETKSNWVAARAGDKHGRTGVDPMPDLVIKARIGEEPTFDPQTNTLHAELEARSKVHPQLAEWQAGVQHAEKAQTKYAKRWLLWAGFLALLLIEYAGISELLAGQGMEPPSKTLVAIAGSAIFFSLTHMASKAKSRVWFAVLLLGSAAFVLSMALLWRDNTASEDTDALTSWAAAIFLAIAVAGPGLLAKTVFASLVLAEMHAKERRRLLREIKHAEAIKEQAVTAIRHIQNWTSWHRQESNRMRSIYTLAYQEARAQRTRVGVENPYQS